jgi:hypothetical protein
VPGGAKLNLRWRLPNNGAFAAAALQPADPLAEYLAAHASEATEAQEREQLHGRGAEHEAALQGEGKERARADELELELERANARNQELQLRIDTLVRDLALRESSVTDELKPPELRGDGLAGEALAGEHRTLQEHLIAVPHGQTAPFAVPQLGSRASSGRAWRLWAARHSQGEAGPLSAPPLPRLLELAARLRSRRLHRLLTIQAVTAQLEGVQANAAALHGRLVHKEAELLAAQAEAA